MTNLTYPVRHPRKSVVHTVTLHPALTSVTPHLTRTMARTSCRWTLNGTRLTLWLYVQFRTPTRKVGVYQSNR